MSYLCWSISAHKISKNHCLRNFHNIVCIKNGIWHVILLIATSYKSFLTNTTYWNISYLKAHPFFLPLPHFSTPPPHDHSFPPLLNDHFFPITLDSYLTITLLFNFSTQTIILQLFIIITPTLVIRKVFVVMICWYLD